MLDAWTGVVALIAAIIGTAVGLLAVRRAKWPNHEAMRAASVDRFRATRQYMKEHVHDLAQLALASQSRFLAKGGLPLLARPGWILSAPIPLTHVVLQLVDRGPAHSCDAAMAKLRTYWPVGAHGERMQAYHEAMTEFDRPTNWYNGLSYRLLDVTRQARTLAMTFTSTRYWEMFDTTEVLLYEAAWYHDRSHGRRIDGPYRRFLADPFDFNRRSAIPGIDAVTIRLDRDGATFYVHRRDAKDVASALNVTGICPAGEFQPSDDSNAAYLADFDLWRTVMREYIEEFLGLEDARARVGAPIDYVNEPPYSLLNMAYTTGAITPYCFGIGLDPVTWKPTILTVCVFEGGLFDRLFAGMVRRSGEGMLELPSRQAMPTGVFKGQSFTEDVVMSYVRSPEVLPAARAGLSLAWRFRDRIGIGR